MNYALFKIFDQRPFKIFYQWAVCLDRVIGVHRIELAFPVRAIQTTASEHHPVRTN